MKMIIGGKKVDSLNGKTIDIINPATGEFIDTVPAATKEDINAALDYSKIGFAKWRRVPHLEREKIFRRFIDLMYREDNYTFLLKSLAKEMGKSITGAYFEIVQAEGLFRGFIETAKRYEGRLLVPGTEVGHDGRTEKDLQMVVYEPVGTVVAIVPFNAPLLLFSFKVAAALAAGNAVIVKPPSDNPLAVIKAVELLHEAGVPGEALQIVTARGSDLGNLLFDDPRIDAIAMTGSTDLGIEIAGCASKHLIPCGLELGGNDPFILFPDGDMEEAAALAAFTRTGNAGQVCISPKRFIIHKSIVKEFTEKVLAHVKTIKMGFDEDLDAGVAELLSGKEGNVMEMGLMGPIINERAAKTVEQQIRHTMDQGATLLYGGKRNGTFVEPTIFTGVTRDMDIAKDMEIFGPVIPIIEFETAEEAIEIANQSIFGLSGCVFTKDWQLGMRVAQEVQSGGMIVNGTSLYRNLMQPFGGYKMSGMGREGFVTLGEMMQEKTIIFKGFLS